MEYQEYKKLRSERRILAGIDNSKALILINYLPKQYQYAHIFWSWVWILSIPAFIGIAIFYKWWIGLILLFFMTPMISRATKKSAAQFVLEHAEENEEFFNKVVGENSLTFKQVN